MFFARQAFFELSSPNLTFVAGSNAAVQRYRTGVK
jgi:hypothetical protein